MADTLTPCPQGMTLPPAKPGRMRGWLMPYGGAVTVGLVLRHSL